MLADFFVFLSAEPGGLRCGGLIVRYVRAQSLVQLNATDSLQKDYPVFAPLSQASSSHHGLKAPSTLWDSS